MQTGQAKPGIGVALVLLLILVGAGSGCRSMGPRDDLTQRVVMSDIPRELNKTTLPTYRVEPPDILLIEAVNNIRPPHAPLRAGDELTLRLQNGLPIEVDVDPELDPLQYDVELQTELEFKVINGTYRIGADGVIDLGPEYGQVRVAGYTLDAAKKAIEDHLRKNVGLAQPRLSVSLPSIGGDQPISGEHLVRPDGTIDLGIYGSVYVAGMTLQEIQATVRAQLSAYVHEPEIRVDVLSYNSKSFYVIMDGGGLGERVVRLPVTGNETVLDAIAQIEGLSEVSSKRMWIARPAPAGAEHAQVLDVDWDAITAEGVTTTNYQLLPGDRIYVQADKMVAFDTFLGRLTAPIERVFGVTLLGIGAAESIEFYGQFLQGGRGGGVPAP